MKRRSDSSRQRIAQALVLASASVAALAFAGPLATAGAKSNASEWPSFRGNPQLTGTTAHPLPVDLEVVWTQTLEEGFESSAAMSGASVYIGGMDGAAHAFELETGRRLWIYRAAAEIRSSPLVLDETVYFGDEAGVFHAVDARTGTRRWLVETGASIVSSANFVRDRLVFGSYDNHLYCLAQSSGALVWKYPTGGYIHGTPAVFGHTVAVAGCDGVLRLIQVKDGTVADSLGLGTYVGASLSIVAGRGFVGTFDNQVLGIDLEKGELQWRFEDPHRHFPFMSSAAVLDSIVVIGGRDQAVRGLHADTGRLLWTFAAGSKVDSSPVIAGDRVFFGTSGGRLYGLDVHSGEQKWHYEAGGSFVASTAVAKGKLVIGSTDGTLYCFGRTH